MSADTVEGIARLRIPFPPAQVGHLPRGGITLEYVGHGAVTSRLLDVDPSWNWEPLSFDNQGQPLFQVDADGNPVGLWIRLTVLGVSRLGFGSCGPKQFDAEKVLIGDALRNAAMRFGVALDLWIKGHAEDDEKLSAKDDRTPPARRQAPPPFDLERFVKSCTDLELDPSDVLAHAQIAKPLEELTEADRPALKASLAALSAKGES